MIILIIIIALGIIADTFIIWALCAAAGHADDLDGTR